VPEQIDQCKDHRAKRCPDCGGRLQRCNETRTRYTEDIPGYVEAEVTEHTIHRDFCPKCRKMVEPVVPDALPKATFGNRVLVMTAWLHYALGNTVAQITEVFNYHFQLKISAGGLTQMWARLAEVLWPWYEAIHNESLQSAVLHADETGWRVNGKTHWLWCFGNPDLTFYIIDRSRGSPALQEFFTEHFAGVLVTDFWGAYNAVSCADRQMCLAHLLRELKTVEKYKDAGGDWPEFAKKLKRLLRDAIRLVRRHEQLPEGTYASRRARIDHRLGRLIDTAWTNREARRLVKRLRRHRGHLFTFLEKPWLPFDNNHAERSIRPAVVMRKSSYANRSARGAGTQAVLMSIFRTLKQRNHHPTKIITEALTTYLTTGQLPPLPQKTASSG
jgi:transposase